MVPLSRVYIGEMWKTVKRPMTWALGIALAALVILIYGTLIATIVIPDSLSIEVEVESGAGTLEDSLMLPEGLFMGIGLVQLMVTTLIIILAAGIVGSDLSWGTVRTMLMLGAGRIYLLLAKILTLITIGLGGLIIGLMLTLGGSILTGFVVGEGFRASEWMTAGFLVDSIVVIGRALIGVTIWALVAGTLTLTTRSVPAGLGASLALLFVGGQVAGLLSQLGEFGTWLGRAVPNSAIDALMALNSASPPHYTSADWVWILANIIGWAAVLIIIGVMTFRRMDTLAASS